MTDLADRGEDRDQRRRGLPFPPAPGGMDGMGGLHLRVAILPAAAITVLGIATVAFALGSGRSATATQIVLIAAAALTALVLIAAVSGAAAATRRLQREAAALQSASRRAQDELRLLSERATPVGPDQRVEVFVNLARRMQSLAHREIQLLDELESQVEDPDLLTGLFTVDHLATRMRRQSESLAVLGGAVSRRRWSRPVTVHEVLRAAVAEVEHYARVTVVPPVEGTLSGSAVTDVIHLMAELIENATKFSAPHTEAVVRAESVTAGLVIEVEDRGLGMLPADQQRMNGLLADPGQVNVGELLRDGRIGLFVVATLARRHGIKVRVQSNIYGGIQAVVVLPATLIEATPPVPAAPVDAEAPSSEPPPDPPDPPPAERPKLPRRAGRMQLAPELPEARARRSPFLSTTARGTVRSAAPDGEVR
jgi:signal transduction histidine kinase